MSGKSRTANRLNAIENFGSCKPRLTNNIYMGEFIILIGILIFLSVPIITARFAKRMGRRPWLWFFIGMILPVIASFILFFLPDLTDSEH